MAFDTPTRNRLARLVAECRDLLTTEFNSKLQEFYGIYPDEGRVLTLEKLSHLDDERLRVAGLLRERIDHIVATDAAGDLKGAVNRILREQAFTVLNRFAALRMAEERGIIVESVGGGLNSKAFKTFSEVAFSGLGDAYQRYRTFLNLMFDELARDLGSLFDRRSPYGLLFPREDVLLKIFEKLNVSDLKGLWCEDETIGWIYQYYNDPAERKKMRDESSAPRNSRELAVRNQFFTPRYVVEFLTDNTLGRLWHEMTRGETALQDRCRYLVRRPTEIFLKAGESVPESEKTGKNLSQEEHLQQPVHTPHRPLKDPREIRLIDPACGSMHFGLYAFDLFTVIYDEAWEIAHGPDDAAKSAETFAPFVTFAVTFPDKAAFLREIPRLIVERNIHGIDIDPRAAQIAGLSLWLRAQRAWHQASVKPVDRPRITRSNLVCAEPMPGEKELLREFVEQQFPASEWPAFAFLLEKIFDHMTLAGEAGSLLRIEEEIRAAIAEARALAQSLSVPRQARLFPGDERPEQAEFDLRGLNDEQFWQKAEQRIYDALEAYAEQAENGGGFQRRLFADDAAQGFAFIDLCRKRYDVALMNPPFGVCASAALEYVRSAYPIGYVDLFTAFIDRGCELNSDSGLLGAITSRTGFFLSSFEAWRRATLLGTTQLNACIDLGQGVLDGAMVETAAYTIARRNSADSITFFRLSDAVNKEAALLTLLTKPDGDVFIRKLEEMLETPAATIAYSMPAELAEDFRALPAVDKLARIVRGSATSDDERFIRTTWEVPPAALFCQPNRRWRWLSKGGDFGAFYAPIHLVLEWKHDGGYLGEFMYQKRPRNGYLWGPKSWSREFIGKPGVVWPLRSQKGVSFRLLPADCAFSHKSPAVMSGNESADFALLAVLNTHRIQRLADCLTTFGSYEMGVIGSLPLDSTKLEGLTSLGKDGFDSVRMAWSMIETDPNHLLLGRRGVTKLADFIEELKGRVDAAQREIVRVLKEINVRYAGCEEATDLRHADALESVKEEVGLTALTSELVGTAFGRWDIRYATGERPAPELPSPFAPLPVCQPGMLQGDDGLPLLPEAGRRLRTEGRYPLDVAWGGILVDDQEHPLDLERRVHAILAVLWEDRANALEQEACALLGVPSLREWFRRPGGFFADHLKRYSKSRRQAPIYWPLSTPSGSYTLWIYYHRLTDQTIFQCVNDFVKPKITGVEGDLARVMSSTSDERTKRSEVERLTAFRSELIDFQNELLRVAQLPYKPNLNDGVLITAAPLWQLFHLPKWQKALKECWESLSSGEYDWAHLALSIWPDRVKRACERDRSIAIAHGLEHLCKVEPLKTKAKRRDKQATNEEAEELDV